MTDRCPPDESVIATLRDPDSEGAPAGLADRYADDADIENQLRVFKALSHEHRLRVLEALRDGELCACELEAILDAPQSTVASHLRKLRDAGLVRTRKQGKWTYYRIADTASIQLADLAQALGEATS